MTSLELWAEVLNKIQGEYFMSRTDFNAFIRVLRPLCIKGDNLIVLSPNRFTLNVINRRFIDHLEKAMSKVTNMTLVIVPPEDEDKYTADADELIPELYDYLPVQRPILDPKYTFENFVTCDANNLAHATAWAISNNPGEVFNPFFIYGKSGIGKTHLMQAIGHRVLERDNTKRVHYVSTEAFTNELIFSIKSTKNPDMKASFKNKYRNLDVLLIDDIQFLENKDFVQEEFFHTFNALMAKGAQIVMASDRLPKDIKPIEERLVSRFESGIVADIKMPDKVTRFAILEKAQAFNKYTVPTEIMWKIAENVTNNIRELESALRRTNANATILNIKQDDLKSYSMIVDSVLADMKLQSKLNTTIDPQNVLKYVAKKFNLEVKDIVGSGRNSDVSLARHIAMYIIRELTELSYPNIGAYFGKDHTSVIYACRKLRESTKKDPNLKRTIDKFTRDIKRDSHRSC